MMFDDVHDPDSGGSACSAKPTMAREAGIEVVKVSPILSASPDRARFSCLDHIHMTEPYHRLMAKEWLRVILVDSAFGETEDPLPPYVSDAFFASVSGLQQSRRVLVQVNVGISAFPQN